MQVMVEKYYLSVSSFTTIYYIGLEKQGNLWYWYDGNTAGNGQPSYGNGTSPYAHWRFDFLAQLATNPTWTCIIAYDWVYTYDQVRLSNTL